MRRFLRELIVAPAVLYRVLISPWTPATCRFAPTCSQYWIDAVRVHGVLRGCWLGVRRLLRCHPFCDGGHDPVPEPRTGPDRSHTREP